MDITYVVIVGILSIIIILCCALYRIGRTVQKNIDISNLPVVAGTILIETSDPDGPYLFLDLDLPVDVIGNQKSVICKISTNGNS